VSRDMHHLWKRHNVFWFQVAVPERHRAAFQGKKTVAYSLDTDSLSQAQALRDEHLAAFRRKVRALEGGMLDAEDLASELARDRRLRSGFSAANDANIAETVGDDIAAAAARLGVTLAPGSAAWRQLGLALLQARAADTQRDMAVALAESFPETPAPQAANGDTFDKMLRAYMDTRRHAGSKPDTLAGIEHIGKAFSKFLGAGLGTIDSRTAVAFRDNVRAAGRDVRTVNRYMATLKAVFEHGRNEGIFPAAVPNPFKGKRVELTKLETEKRKRAPYRLDEIQKVFAAFQFETRPRVHTIETALPWVTLIAAYTGARREDICSLRAKDLTKHNGITCFAFGHGDYQGKTVAAKRLTPMHSALAEAGLLDYAQALPKDSLLFPALKPKPSRPDKRGVQLGNHYAALLERLGIARPGLGFHSWRGTVITALQRAGVVVEDREIIVGHEGKGVNRGYVELSAEDLARLASHVEKIQYEGIKLV
jgi:integrase